jgi:hypothetical protein
MTVPTSDPGSEGMSLRMRGPETLRRALRLLLNNTVMENYWRRLSLAGVLLIVQVLLRGAGPPPSAERMAELGFGNDDEGGGSRPSFWKRFLG